MCRALICTKNTEADSFGWFVEFYCMHIVICMYILLCLIILMLKFKTKSSPPFLQPCTRRLEQQINPKGKYTCVCLQAAKKKKVLLVVARQGSGNS